MLRLQGWGPTHSPKAALLPVQRQWPSDPPLCCIRVTAFLQFYGGKASLSSASEHSSSEHSSSDHTDSDRPRIARPKPPTGDAPFTLQPPSQAQHASRIANLSDSPCVLCRPWVCRQGCEPERWAVLAASAQVGRALRLPHWSRLGQPLLSRSHRRGHRGARGSAQHRQPRPARTPRGQVGIVALQRRGLLRTRKWQLPFLLHPARRQRQGSRAARGA